MSLLEYVKDLTFPASVLIGIVAVLAALAGNFGLAALFAIFAVLGFVINFRIKRR